jgi:aminopeptidase N
VRCAVLALALLLVAAGCGSSGEKRLSKEEYAQRADAVCRRTNRLTQSPGDVSSMPALARFADRTLKPLDRALRDLRALRPPKEEQATANAWLRQLALLRSDAVRIRDRARENDAHGVSAVAVTASARNERFKALAAQLGMTVCSRD